MGTTFRWKGTTASAAFAVYYGSDQQGFITLPRNILSLLASAYGQTGPTNTAPSYQLRFSSQPIRGPWAEFAPGAFGVGDQVPASGMLDWGDDWTTFQDFPADEPSYLRVVTEQSETGGAAMVFRGTDANGNDIYSGSGTNTILGVSLTIGGIAPPSFSQTTQVFGAPPTLVQKPVTFGPIKLYAVGATTGTVTLIAIYDPGDTSPGFRRYKLGGMFFTTGQTQAPFTTLHAMVKRRFVPAVAMTDPVIPSNKEAIELGLQGRRYDLQSENDTAGKFWADAFGILNAEVAEFRGAAVPKMIFQRGASLVGNVNIN